MKHMQCPHCYKTDLHPKATRCHHCGGEIEHETELNLDAVIYIVVAFVVIFGLYLFVLVSNE